jgi:hypothetical protein
MPIDIDILDDLLPPDELAWVQQLITDANFPWYWYSNTYGITVAGETDPRVFEADQFSHHFCQLGEGVTSDWFVLVEKILTAAGRRRQCDFDLLRAKANLLMPSVQQGEFNTPHRDLTEPHCVVLFYLFDSDGDTVFFSNDCAPWQETRRIQPRANRAVVFDGSVYHASCHPRINARRMVLNCDVRQVSAH